MTEAAPYTAGNLRPFNYITESNFGVTPATALIWGGELLDVHPVTNMKMEEIVESGSATYGDVVYDPPIYGFEAKLITRKTSGGFDWRAFFATFGMCGATGSSTFLSLPASFTAQIAKLVGAAYSYNFYSGCYIDRLKMSWDKPMREVIFDIKVLSQYVQPSTGKTITGHQAVTVGADASPITTDLLRWANNPQISYGGGPPLLADLYAKKCSLTIDHHLEPAPEGIATGADATKRPMPIAFAKGKTDILFEVDLESNTENWTNAKLARSSIEQLVPPHFAASGEYHILLATGYFVGDDLAPIKASDVNRESFKAKFKSCTLVAP
jgi:hypothetical protein